MPKTHPREGPAAPDQWWLVIAAALAVFMTSADTGPGLAEIEHAVTRHLGL